MPIDINKIRQIAEAMPAEELKQHIDNLQGQLKGQSSQPQGILGGVRSFGQGLVRALPYVLNNKMPPQQGELNDIQKMQYQNQFELERQKQLSEFNNQLEANKTQDVYGRDESGKLAKMGTVPANAKVDLVGTSRENTQHERTWNHIVDKTDALAASSRSGLGMAVNANIRANRALSVLNRPIVTPSEMGSIQADLAAIFQGGAPTDLGMHEQKYNTLYQKWAEINQYMTAHPQNAISPEIKTRLSGIINDLRKLDSDIIDTHFQYYEKAYKKAIANHPDEWEDMKKTYKESALQGGDVGGVQQPQINQTTQLNGQRVGKYTLIQQ